MRQKLWGGSLCNSFNGAAGVWCHLIEVQPNRVFNYSPLRAIFMLGDCVKPHKGCGTHREQPARIVSDAFRLAFFAESLRRTATALCGLFHISIMLYHKCLDL
jgi:hypothetical protein